MILLNVGIKVNFYTVPALKSRFNFNKGYMLYCILIIYLFLCTLLNDAISSSDYIVSSGRIYENTARSAQKRLKRFFTTVRRL
jgi:hypothetical protein